MDVEYTYILRNDITSSKVHATVSELTGDGTPVSNTEGPNATVFMGAAFTEELVEVAGSHAGDRASVVGTEGADRTLLVGAAFLFYVVTKITANGALVLDAE
jgi:hypothetical protein